MKEIYVLTLNRVPISAYTTMPAYKKAHRAHVKKHGLTHAGGETYKTRNIKRPIYLALDTIILHEKADK